MPQPEGADLDAVRARRAALREQYLHPAADRPVTPTRGVHHVAFVCRDVEETIRFHQDLLGFPLVELVENRDYAGSSHFFFDLGHGNLLGFFDFPGHDHRPFEETIGALQHLALSTPADRFEQLRAAVRGRGHRRPRPRPRDRRQPLRPGPQRRAHRVLPRGPRRVRGHAPRRPGLRRPVSNLDRRPRRGRHPGGPPRRPHGDADRTGPGTGGRPQGPARRRHRRAPGAAHTGAADGRRVVFLRPLRTGRHRRVTRHAGAAAPAHRPADRVLAARRQRAPPRQPGPRRRWSSRANSALMTAGHGIAHSEQCPVRHPALLHGTQLWVALPDSGARGRARLRAPHRAARPPTWPAPGCACARRIRRADVAGHAALAAGRARRHPRRRRSTRACPSNPTSSTPRSPLDGRPDGRRRAACRSGRCSTSAPAAAACAWPGPAGSCCWAANRSPSRSSCGGTCWAAPTTRSPTCGRRGTSTTARFGNVPGWRGQRTPAPALPGGRLRARGAAG